VTRYVEERRDAFGVEPICAAIGVPVSTHYARRPGRSDDVVLVSLARRGLAAARPR